MREGGRGKAEGDFRKGVWAEVGKASGTKSVGGEVGIHTCEVIRHGLPSRVERREDAWTSHHPGFR
jgi:hypothetical protein